MNPSTTEIRDFDTKEAADDAGFTLQLTKEEAEKLRGMNRQQRRKWLRANGHPANTTVTR